MGLAREEKHVDAIMETAVAETRPDIPANTLQPKGDPCSNSVVTTENAPQERCGRLDLARRSCTSSAGFLDAPCTLLTGTSAREKRLGDVPLKYRGLYRRAWEGQSRKSAIRAFCLECVGWSQTEAQACTARACPLFQFRERG